MELIWGEVLCMGYVIPDFPGTCWFFRMGILGSPKLYYLWGASHPDHALEPSAPKGGARYFLGPTGQAGARPRGVPSAVIPTNRAAQGRVGLAEKKSWSCHLRPSGS